MQTYETRRQHLRSEFTAHQYLLAQTGATPHRANRRRVEPVVFGQPIARERLFGSAPAFGTNRDPLAWGLVALAVQMLVALSL